MRRLLVTQPARPTRDDALLTAYAELHELVRRYLAGDASARTLRRRHAEIEDDLRRALGLLPYPIHDQTETELEATGVRDAQQRPERSQPG